MKVADTPQVLGELIDDRAEKNGNKIFLFFKNQKISYEEIRNYANQCANAFTELGVAKGDKVSIMLPNCPEFLYAWFGLAKCGAVEVPVNTAYKGDYLLYNIAQSDSKILIIAAEYLERLKLIEDKLEKVEKIIVLGKNDQGNVNLKIPVMSFSDFFNYPKDFAEATVYPWDPLSIIYTSGTTGVSKGALCPHKFWIVCAEKMLEYRDGRKDDIFYNFMPLYHFNAQCLTVVTALVAEAQMVLAERFSASRFWDDIRYYGATQFNYLGGVMPILAKQPVKPEDSDNPARIAIGAACPPEVMDEVEKRFNIKCLEGFGMTEIGIPIQIRADDDRKRGSCGKAMDIYEIKLFDEYENEVPVGEIGEIVFRPKEAYTMMLEYYNMPEKTLESYRNLWFHTGDLARKDNEGFFYFVDRKKDAIRRRGENISSFEVERVVNSHPSVLESAALAVPSEIGEDEVKICVVLKPGHTLTAKELIEYCDERMPYFAVPRFVEFMDSLPKTPTERVEKHKLKQAGITENTWDKEKEKKRSTN